MRMQRCAWFTGQSAIIKSDLNTSDVITRPTLQGFQKLWEEQRINGQCLWATCLLTKATIDRV